MGNKCVKNTQLVTEEYTRPQGLYQHPGLDLKLLRKLIINNKLAPCYPGENDRKPNLEECQICYLNYPSLNTCICCSQAICTECFLKMQSPRPTTCPFCNAVDFKVEYRGVRPEAKIELQQIEEERVAEAMRRAEQKKIQQKENMEQPGCSKIADPSSSGLQNS